MSFRWNYENLSPQRKIGRRSGRKFLFLNFPNYCSRSRYSHLAHHHLLTPLRREAHMLQLGGGLCFRVKAQALSSLQSFRPCVPALLASGCPSTLRSLQPQSPSWENQHQSTISLVILNACIPWFGCLPIHQQTAIPLPLLCFSPYRMSD